MPPPPTPSNEAQRLRALAAYEILDTPSEAEFDALTRLAAHILSAPVALVSFVDAERQWFKSHHGIDIKETPRAVSFCGHVVALDAPLVVSDARTDERFSDSPLVTGEPHICFYAGIPLRSPDGFVLGTLCAIDNRPRELSPEQREMLTLLAGQVVSQLELRRQARMLATQHRALVAHRQFFELSPDLLATADSTLHYQKLNPAWESTLGWTKEELRARPFVELLHPDDLDGTLREAERLLKHSATTINFVNRHRHRDGRWVPLSWVVTAHDGILYGAGRDMSSYFARERALVASHDLVAEREDRLRALFDGMYEGALLLGHDGHVIGSNRAAAQILGLGDAEMLGLRENTAHWAYLDPQGAPIAEPDRPFSRALKTGEPQRDVTVEVRRGTGSRLWLTVNSQPIRSPGLGQPSAVVVTFRDVTKQQVAEQALAEERSFLSTVLEHIPGATIGVFDHNLVFVRAFGGATNLLSTNTLHGQPVSCLGLPMDHALLISSARACLEGRSARLDLTRGGARLEVRFVPWAEGDGDRLGLVLVYDVTERDQLREQLSRHERLVTVGTLAAGVGHEINNPLAYVLSNIDVLLADLRHFSVDTPAYKFAEMLDTLEEARVGANRIRNIVKGLRALASPADAPCPTDVHTALEVSINIAMHEIRHRAELVTRLLPVPPVVADEARLSQVFVNLIVNAAQAFQEHDPAQNRIDVTTRTTESGEVEICVSDNGPGIAPEVLPRIFDPFFTSKPIGVGTGLGLAMCHNVITSLNGTIDCQTAVGLGTTFRVTLPAATGAVEPVSSSAAPPPPEVVERPRARVLVVDDDAIVLRAVVRILQRDHDVTGLQDPRGVLALLLEEQKTFDVVICDIMMPQMNGMELYRAVAKQRPEIAERFVFISGGATQDEVRDFLSGVPNERVEKPFDSAVLRDLVAGYA